MIRHSPNDSRSANGHYYRRNPSYVHRYLVAEQRPNEPTAARVVPNANRETGLKITQLDDEIFLPAPVPTPSIHKRAEQFLPELSHQNFL